MEAPIHVAQLQHHTEEIERSIRELQCQNQHLKKLYKEDPVRYKWVPEFLHGPAKDKTVIQLCRETIATLKGLIANILAEANVPDAA